MLTEAEKWQRKLKILTSKKQEIYNTIAQAMSEAQLKIDKHMASCKHQKEYLNIQRKDWGDCGDASDYDTDIYCTICGKKWHLHGKWFDIQRSK